MHKINFKKLVIQNFICFGNEPSVIEFDQSKNIVMIKGKNLDTVPDMDDSTSSNGSGKSTILDAFIYGLFGKTVKNPKKIGTKDVINNIIGKKMVVEIYFDDYKVQRTRKPDGLKFWKDASGKFDTSTELTRGEMKQTQSMIESVLGFNYETMKSICAFTDNNSDSYLESAAQERRNIIENLLGLEKYRKFHEKTKEFIKQNKQETDLNANELNKLKTLVSTHETNIKSYSSNKETWKNQINADIKKYNLEIEMLEKQIKEIFENNKEIEAYNKAVAELEEKEKELEQSKSNKENQESVNKILQDKMKEMVNEMQNKKDELTPFTTSLALAKNKISTLDEEIRKIDNLSDGVECGHCFSKVSHNNCSNIKSEKINSKQQLDSHVDEINKSITDIKKDLQDKLTAYKNAESLLNKSNAEIKLIKSSIDLIEKRISELRKIEKPEISVILDMIKNKIALQKSLIVEKESQLNGKSPYCDLIEKTNNDIQVLNEKINCSNTSIEELKNKLKLYEFWLDAFSEKGIRKFIIEQILPVLNKTIVEMLDILIEGKLSLVFDSEFNEKITKFPDDTETPYDLLSNGQKRRINLALSQAFAYVRQLNVGNYPSIMFLDEVSINMDSQGNNAIHNLIRNLAKDKQVFVTTHDQELQSLLMGEESQTLVVEMKNGFSKIVKK